MRKDSRVWAAALAALIGTLVSGCGGSGEPDISASELMREYTKSTDVKNDVFPGGGTSEDRIANIAAHVSADQLPSALLAAGACEAATEKCPRPGAAERAVRDFAGKSGEAFERSVLVKREDGSLELLRLYVARKADKTAALVDSDGRTYTGGLDDFREHNELLSADDVMLAPRGITAVPGEGDIVTVSGHTSTDWTPWRIGGLATVLAVGGVVVARMLVLQRRQAPAPYPDPDPAA